MAVQTHIATEQKHIWEAASLSIASYDGNEHLVDQARFSLQLAASYSFNRRHEDGHWYGELKSNATITAEYVMLRQALGLDMSHDRDELVAWLLSDQNEDGSWGIAPDHPGDVSTTTEAYFALKLLGVQPSRVPLRRARKHILSTGGAAKVRIFTRIYLATFGLFPWKAVPELPAELILLPTISPIGIYRLSSWARSTIVPLLVVAHHRPIYSLPNGKSASNDFLDELWHDAANKAVPYSPLLRDLWKTDVVAFIFTAVDTALHWIEHQESEGDWAGIFPPMHVGVLALRLEGYQLDDPPVRAALEAIERFAWRQGGKEKNPSMLVPNWIASRQLLGPEGDWRIYKPNLPPGGFSFEYFNKWYPDVDDTAAAILSMVKQNPQSRSTLPVTKAAMWIIGMQNHDGGWGAFDVNNDKLFLNKIPFSDMESLCDPSTADVTGRVLEAFGLIIKLSSDGKDHILIDRINVACCRALTYLTHHQETSGAWYGRWGSNYIYGTSNVLCGMKYFSDGCTVTAEGDDSIKDCMDSAVSWIKSMQNPNGGWGGNACIVQASTSCRPRSFHGFPDSVGTHGATCILIGHGQGNSRWGQLFVANANQGQ
ncbi:hypothetical protein N7526_011429 [Penicillium atrosanguineum]|nr:hypothetical protein N7526_011429 [Penicillium atrosanguineum]